MTRVPHRPQLDVEATARLLEAMRAGQDFYDHPLTYFLSVSESLTAPHALTGDSAVQAAVFNHVISIITERLHQLQAQYADEKTVPDIVSDFRQNNTELQAWSLLFHRYVAVDEDLSMQDIAALVNQGERTLRRRLTVGLQRLTQRLVEIEQKARRKDTYRRLLLNLPRSTAPRLHGAEATLAIAKQILQNDDPPHHLLLYGPLGIGKTSLALAIAHQMIREGNSVPVLDDLVWLDLPWVTDPAGLASEIINRLELPHEFDGSPEQILRAYLFAHRVLIVLDDAESLAHYPDRMEAALELLDLALVLITSPLPAPQGLWVYQIRVPELSREDALALLEAPDSPDSPRTNQVIDQFEAIWNAAGGNPLALKLTAASLRAVPVSSPRLFAGIDHLYTDSWERLTPEARRVWIATLLFPRSGILYETLEQLLAWEAAVLDTAINELVESALLSVHQSQKEFLYALQTAAATFLIQRVKSRTPVSNDECINDFVLTLLDKRVDQVIADFDPQAAQLILRLVDEFGVSDASRQWRYAYQLMPRMIEAGLWHTLPDYLTRLASIVETTQQEAWLNCTRGIVWRWMGRFEEARQYLEYALKADSAHLVSRGDVLVERAIVCRYLGDWDGALRCAEQALDHFVQQGSEAGFKRSVYELAQLALEAKQPDQALAWLAELDEWSAQAWTMAGQAYLLLERYQDALQTVHAALDLLPAQHHSRGRVIATLGQIYSALGQHTVAAGHLTSAAKILEQARDEVGCARVFSNLAAVYLSMPMEQRPVTREEIHALLQQAQDIQEHARDEIGLAVTRKNLQWLQNEESGANH